MKHLLTFLLLCLSLHGSTEQVSQKQPFIVTASISSDTVAIDQLVTLQVTMKYPADYHPNIDILKRRLLHYGGFGEAPFALSQYISHPIQKSEGAITQQFDFILVPQLSGKHFLTPYMVSFESNTNEGPSVEISSEAFAVDVFVPKVDFDPQSVIEPPMALSRELPVSLSQENMRVYLKNPPLVNREAEKIRLLLTSKSFPWLAAISGIAVLLVIVFARLLSSSTIENKSEAEAKEKDEFEIRKELKKTISNKPKNRTEAITYVLNLDSLIRRYLANKYNIPALSLTSTELMANSSDFKNLPPSAREKINTLFNLADKMKFANYSPTPEDCQDLAEWHTP